jgi:uroporphyrinogen decarboxylase
MARDSMTPKERWLAVLAGHTPDRVPMDYWGTEEATRSVVRYLGCRTRWQMFERLHIDKVVSVAPEYIGPKLPRATDMYGRRYRNVSYGSGRYRECVHNPLAQFESIAEIEANYTWPSTAWFDYSVIPRQLRGRKRDYPIQGGGSEPFLIYADLRGRELAYMDLVLRPEMVHHCLDRLFDFCYKNTVRIYEQLPGQVNLSYVAEDFGGQENLLYSRQAIGEFFLPRMKRMIDLAHEAGVYAFFHSDGAIRPIIPDMLDIGIDVLNPLQWRSPGMELGGLKRDFGDKVVLHGGVDNQQTLAFGTVDDVRAEVVHNLEILSRGGNYILAPCHNIQAVSPPENVVAMYEMAYEVGGY